MQGRDCPSRVMYIVNLDELNSYFGVYYLTSTIETARDSRHPDDVQLKAEVCSSRSPSSS